MAASDGCALSVPGLKDALTLNRRAPPPNVSVKKSEVHVGDNIYCQGTVNMYVDTTSPDIIKSIAHGKTVTANDGWRGWLASLSRKQKAVYLTALILTISLLLFLSIFFPLRSLDSDQSDQAEYALVNRSMWLAKGSGSRVAGPPVKLVIVTQTGFSYCSEGLACASLVAHLQHLARESGLPDLPYHFLAAGDGRVYEGLGWPQDEPLSLAMVGGFTKRSPPSRQVAAAFYFLREATTSGPLQADYGLSVGLCPTGPYGRPDRRLRDIVPSWPHYVNVTDKSLCTLPHPLQRLNLGLTWQKL